MKKEESFKILKINPESNREEIQKAFDLAVKEFIGLKNGRFLGTEEKMNLEKILTAYKLVMNKKNNGAHFSPYRFAGVKDEDFKYLKIDHRALTLSNSRKDLNVRREIVKGERKRKMDEHPIALLEPQSMASEQYRVLYSRFKHMNGEGKQKRIAISSSVKGEGKTTTSVNLGVTMAKDFNKKTLIIEGDLKKPDLHRYLKSPCGKGLVDILARNNSLEECIYPFLTEKLFMLPAGSNEKNSTRLLSLPKMAEALSQAEMEFEYIIIDSPPVLPLADMNIFSELVNGILFVVRAGMTPRDLVLKAFAGLPAEKVWAIVLNGMESGFTRYYGYPY